MSIILALLKNPWSNVSKSGFCLVVPSALYLRRTLTKPEKIQRREVFENRMLNYGVAVHDIGQEKGV